MEMGNHKIFKKIPAQENNVPVTCKTDVLKEKLNRLFSNESIHSFDSESSNEMMK